MPVADCGDYVEIPLSHLVQACLREGERKMIAQDARGRLWGLRRNPKKGKRNAAARSVPSNPDNTARVASH